jgi:predicted oxidoreductase
VDLQRNIPEELSAFVERGVQKVANERIREELIQYRSVLTVLQQVSRLQQKRDDCRAATEQQDADVPHRAKHQIQVPVVRVD